MNSPFRLLSFCSAIVIAVANHVHAAHSAALKFDFGSGKVAPGYQQVTAETAYSKERGYGFEPGANLTAVDRGGDALRGDFITSDSAFHFTARVPHEGNYRVTVTLGDANGESTTTIKAELRRLMVEKVHTARGQFQTVQLHRQHAHANDRCHRRSHGGGYAAQSPTGNDAGSMGVG